MDCPWTFHRTLYRIIRRNVTVTVLGKSAYNRNRNRNRNLTVNGTFFKCFSCRKNTCPPAGGRVRQI